MQTSVFPKSVLQTHVLRHIGRGSERQRDTQRYIERDTHAQMFYGPIRLESVGWVSVPPLKCW